VWWIFFSHYAFQDMKFQIDGISLLTIHLQIIPDHVLFGEF
jgi:hypothetical protein